MVIGVHVSTRGQRAEAKKLQRDSNPFFTLKRDVRVGKSQYFPNSGGKNSTPGSANALKSAYTYRLQCAVAKPRSENFQPQHGQRCGDADLLMLEIKLKLHCSAVGTLSARWSYRKITQKASFIALKSRYQDSDRRVGRKKVSATKNY